MNSTPPARTIPQRAPYRIFGVAVVLGLFASLAVASPSEGAASEGAVRSTSPSATAQLATAQPATDQLATDERDEIQWSPCYHRNGSYECARVRVPLDYDDRRSSRIGISLVRLRATDPDRRQGAIFINPGGPGGSGVDIVAEFSPFLFNDEVKARFDLIGFDPRGVHRSAPLLCFESLAAALSVAPPWAFPLGPAQEAVQASLDMAFDAACESDAREIVDHMSTGNVARDIAYIADLMGEDEINYLGASYGSFLGVALVNLFPERVRAVVLDGILDPIAWTTGRPGEEDLPFSTRLGSEASAAATLDEFFRLCDDAGPSGCAFAGDAEVRFAEMADTLRSGPVVIIDPGSGMPFELTYAELIGQTLGAMYDSFSWSNLAALMAYVESQLGLAPAPTASVRAEAGDFRHATRYTEPRNRYPNFVEGFYGVACSDTDNPDGHEHWAVAGAEADAEHGYFGRLWTWSTSPCAVWSGADDDRFMGPFDAATEHPVLVVGTTYDPATPYAGAEVVDDLLPNSSLLTVAGWGHTSLFLSQCADAIVFEYLLTATAPAGGAVCHQDFNPFDIPTAPFTTPESADRHQTRTELLSHVAYQPPSITR